MDMRKLTIRIAWATAEWALVSVSDSIRGMRSWLRTMIDEGWDRPEGWKPDPDLTAAHLEELKKAMGEPHAYVVDEHEAERQSLMAAVAAEILVIAREHGCNCHPTVHVYVMDSGEHALQGARMEHESTCIGQMRAHYGDN